MVGGEQAAVLGNGVGGDKKHASPSISPAADMPRPLETTTAVGAVVTAPHGRARDTVGESLAHVPLETFLQTLEPSGGVSENNNPGTTGVPPLHRDPCGALEVVTFQPVVSIVVLAF